MIALEGRQFARIAALALAALSLAIAVALLLPHVARADIVDFNPDTDPVPTLVPPADLAKLETLMSAGIVYMISEPSPSGRYAEAVMAQSDAFIDGFVDLETGIITPIAEEPSVPGYPVSNSYWIDEDTLGLLYADVEQPEGADPVDRYYLASMDAASGAVEVTEIGILDWLSGFVLDAVPGFQQLLIVELASETPPKHVEFGPTFTGPGPDVPEDIPGRVGGRPLAPIELQQVSFRISLVNLDGSDKRFLLSLPIDSGLAALTWSGDGGELVLGTRTMPGWQESRADRSDPSAIPDLDSINVREALGLVSPTENPLVTGTEFHVFRVDDGSELATLENLDFPAGTLSDAEFSPSGTKALVRIAQRSELAGRPHPTYAYAAGLDYLLLDLGPDAAGAVAPLDVTGVPGADSVVAGATFLDDERIVFAVPNELDTQLYAYDLATQAATPLWSYAGAMMQVLRAGTDLVFSYSNVDHPWELWRMDMPTGVSHQLTSYFRTATEASELAFDDVSWSTSDGETLRGIIVHHENVPFPPAEPGPIVVWQQGGPGGQIWNDYGSLVESPYSLLPQFGIPVLMANAAGRSVKRPAFYSALADGRNFGQIDIGQIKDGVDSLVASDVVDGARVGITGCSYGGYFTLQSIRTFPDLYAAANPQCSLVDLTNEFTFGYTPVISYLMGSSPFAEPAEYLRDSPLYGTKDVKTPTLIFHGTDDFLPVALINNVHDQLDANGVPVRFLRVKGEGHGFSRASSQRYAAQAQLAFFRQYLDVGPFVPPARARIYLPDARR